MSIIKGYSENEITNILKYGMKTDSYGAVVDLLKLKSNAAYLLSRLIEAELHSFSEIEGNKNIELVEEPKVVHPQSSKDTFLHLMHEHYYIKFLEKTKKAVPKRQSDLISKYEWEKGNLYNLLYRQAEFGPQLNYAVKLSENIIIGLTCLRYKNDSDFTDKDVKNLHYLGKIIFKIYKEINKEGSHIEQQILSSTYKLSPKQSEILYLLYKGYQDIEISKRLMISKNTVLRHMEAIRKRLNINSTALAITMAAAALKRI